MDEDDYAPQTFASGSASSTEVTSSSFDHSAILWLPDPESRRGWREYYVDKPKAEKPGALGFKKR